MPQYPEAATIGLNPNGQQVQAKVANTGGLIVAGTSAIMSALNITAQTVIKASPGYVVRISVIVAGSAAGTVNDAATIGAVAAANEVSAILNTVGTYTLEWPCLAGIVVTPGTGQTLSVAFV